MVPGANSEPTLTALYGAGVEYEFYDAETGYLRKPCLFYTGPGWLDRAHQERLAAYVEDGGHLVFFQTLPLRDDTFGPCNALGLVEPVRATNEPFLDHLATETEVCLGPRCVRTRAPFFVYEGNTPGQPIIGHRVDAPLRDTGFEENRYLRSLVISHDYQVGYHERRGRGSVTVVGIRPSAGAVQAVHEFLNVPVPIYSHTPTVKPALFRRGGTWYAVLLNIGDYPVRAALDIAPGLLGRSAYRATSLRRSVPLETDTLVDGRLTIQLPRKNGTVIEIS